MQFWSLGRSGLFAVSGRPTLRAFCAAVASCGCPRVQLGVSGNRTHRWVELGLAFQSRDGRLFRCQFTVRSVQWVRTRASFWYRSNGQPRLLKPSNVGNPLSSMLNRSLFDPSNPGERDLKLWERVLLALGF